MDQFTWREAAAEDAPLLFEIFAANKAPEFAPLGLPEQQLRPLLEMQFRARQLDYSQSYPNALDTILCLEDGTPIGRHLVDRQPDCYRTIDIAVLPEYQSRGVGTWALRHFQQLVEVEGIPFRLSVIKTNPALRLYERLGFVRLAANEVSVEMEWQPARLAVRQTAVPPASSPHELSLPDQIALAGGTTVNRSSIIDTIFAFLREIGLRVHLGQVPATSFLPGIQLIADGLRVDVDALLYPGDLLHEAGHLAVMPPERRHASIPASTTDGGEEMAAIAWSYAAAIYLGLAAEIVFHEHGYRGMAPTFIEGFTTGSFRPGLPLLGWMGLTDVPVYPRMLRWLREASADDPEATLLELAQEVTA